MIEVASETKIAAPTRKIWGVLTDFDRLAEWHPWLKIRGVAAPGASIAGSLDTWGGGRYLPMYGEITEFRERAAISWVLGFRGVFILEERFSIQQIATGASLRHSVTCRGLLVLLLGRAMEKRIGPLLRNADYALIEHLRKQQQQQQRSPAKAGQASTKRRSKGRKGRRLRQ